MGDSSSFTAQYGWLIAVIMVTCASILANIGMNLQKLALTRYEDRKKMLVWWLGTSCMVLGSVGDFLALGFGAQTIVAPLGSMNVVSNIFLAPLMQGEVASRSDVMYTLIIISGSVLAVAFANHEEQNYTLPELFAFFGAVTFRIYMVTIVSVVLSTLYNIKRMERLQRVYGDASEEYASVSKLHRFSYAAISGMAGAQSVLFAKLIVSLFIGWIGGGENLFTNIFSYITALALVMCVVLQVYWLNCGLARWDALYNVPVFASFWIIFSIIGGGVVYGEFHHFSVIQGFMFPGGVAVTVLGVYLLSQRRESVKQHHEDSNDVLLEASESTASPSNFKTVMDNVELHSDKVDKEALMGKGKLALTHV